MTIEKVALLAAFLLCCTGGLAQEEAPDPGNDPPEATAEDIFATGDEEQPDEEPDCE
jgi:hypothetical protein